jgi:glycosyltransferase involved in cell wall biosynthesis
LSILLSLWPNIKKEFPLASLNICYGREHWGICPPEQFNYIIEKIDQYKNLDVIEHGKIGHVQLANIMQNTSIWAYPCNMMGVGETFCITAIKAQLSGCIPVTTRIGALNETVHLDAPSISKIENMEDINRYKNILLQTMRRIGDSTKQEEIIKERTKYIEFAKQYSWDQIMKQWIDFYDQIQ